MNTNHQFTNLPVWDNLMQFVKLIYAISSTFPPEEKEGITRRIRTRIVDLPVLVASGTRNGIQPGSAENMRKAAEVLFEIETLLYVCSQIGILKPNEFERYQEDMRKIGENLHTISSRIEKKFK